MSIFANLTATDFKQLTKLIQSKERLLLEVQKIDAALNAFETGETPIKTTQSVSAPRKSSKRGKLKNRVLAVLKEAGEKGHTVGELSEKLKVKAANLYAWFYTTGKKVAGLKKSKEGRYSL